MADKFGWRPNEYLENPSVFGKEDVNPRWKTKWYGDHEFTPLQEDRLIAAKMQHLVAVEVTRAARLRGETLADVAEHTRMGADQFRRLMRGEGPMQIVDFGTFRRVYRIEFAVEPSPDLANIRETTY